MYILDLIGTLAFAVAGAFKARGRELNVFGVVLLGVITAVGGGTFRDLVIGRTPVFYLKDPNYLLVAVIGSIATYLVPHVFKKWFTFFRFLDSIGLAAFSIIGTSVTYNYLFNDNGHGIIVPLVCIFMGMFTGFGGGVLRDAVMGDAPFAFHKKSGYIMAAFAGAVTFYFLMFINISVAIFISIATTLTLREILSKYGLYKKYFKKYELQT
ncbi:MAG: TRIC cation channel family protein [Candidatus Pacebacteria bacterium]|nr:TRIC cation channel family protein [Candidatus Paceibacterota bacterium]